MQRISIFLLLVLGTLAAGAQTTAADSSIQKKAASWLASLQLNAPGKEARVAAVIATHLTVVRDWNNDHPYTTVPAGIDPSTGKPLSTMDRQGICLSTLAQPKPKGPVTG